MYIKRNPQQQLIHNLNYYYYDGCSDAELNVLNQVYPRVIDRIDTCFSHIRNKYYSIDGETVFDPLHVAQWTMFLYLMSNEMWRLSTDNSEVCDKIYGICKCISSADIFYEVEMPDIWFFDHPQGSVMGKARYSNYFTFSQGCTVGNNKGYFPSFGEHVTMMSGSKVLGNCRVGDHVVFSANSFVIDQDIPPYSIVFGGNRDIRIKSITSEKFSELTQSML